MEEQLQRCRPRKYNIVAMSLFIVSRFMATFLMKFFNPGKMLRTFAVTATILSLGVIFFQDIWGLYCLVAISGCMSLMFPTIYGIALKGMGEDSSLCRRSDYAILGGSLMLPFRHASDLRLGLSTFLACMLVHTSPDQLSGSGIGIGMKPTGEALRSHRSI